MPNQIIDLYKEKERVLFEALASYVSSLNSFTKFINNKRMVRNNLTSRVMMMMVGVTVIISFY